MNVKVFETYVEIEQGEVITEVHFDDGKPNGTVVYSYDGGDYDTLPEYEPTHGKLTRIAVAHYKEESQ